MENSVCLGRTEQREHEERKRTHVLDRFLDARDYERVNSVRVLHLRYLVTGALYLRISRATACVFFIFSI